MIRIAPTPDNDIDRYLGEMLNVWGLAAWQIGDAAQTPDAQTIVAHRDAEVAATELKALLRRGGHVVLIAPGEALFASLGIDCSPSYADDGGIEHLRLSQPLLGTFSHYPIPIVGERAVASGRHYASGEVATSVPPEAQVAAYLYEAGSFEHERPAVWSMPAHGGHVTVFSFDLARCFRDSRQGRPRFAGWRPVYDDICRPSSLFGPDWPRAARTAHQPVTDFLPMLLVRLIEQRLAYPCPRFWQLPGVSDSAMLLSGDEDGATTADIDEVFSFMESLGACMTIYVYMQQIQPGEADRQRWKEAGHAFSAHPYPTWPGITDREISPGGDVLAGLARSVEKFKKMFDLPVPLVRNHRVYWSGYCDVARLWESLGVEMDVNYAYNFADRDFSSGFKTPASALPTKFMDERDGLVDVYQQPVQGGDDADFGPAPKGRALSAGSFAAFGRAVIDNTLKPLGLPFAYIYHPQNFASYAGQQLRAFLKTAHASGCLMLSDHQWLDFWKSRSTWRVAESQRRDEKIRYTLRGSASDQKVAVSLPASTRSITLDGRPVEPVAREHFGLARLLVELPAGCGEVTLEFSSETSPTDPHPKD